MEFHSSVHSTSLAHSLISFDYWLRLKSITLVLDWISNIGYRFVSTLTKPKSTTSYSNKHKQRYPQYPYAEPFTGIFYSLKLLTSESFFHTSSGGNRIKRPLSLRAKRAALWRQTRNASKGKKKQIIFEGHIRDAIAWQFIHSQQEIRVNLENLGEQTGRFVVLTPRHHQTEFIQNPIFFIPGVSNDLEGAGTLVQEIAFTGKTVIVVSYPESWLGNCTDKFAYASEDSKDYEPHISFFKAIIKAIMQSEIMNKPNYTSEIELWGYSTGAVIVAEILKDIEFQQKTKNAVLCSPASCVNQKVFRIPDQYIPSPINSLIEYSHAVFHKNYPYLNVSSSYILEYTLERRKLMLRVYNSLVKKVLQRNNWWQNDFKVISGGKIVVVIGKHDYITHCAAITHELKEHSKFRIIEITNGYHMTPLLEPQRIVEEVYRIIH